jgi:putative phage-type endonuclease
MAKFLGQFESNTPEWHDLRKGKVGGSQVGAILGVNPWESAVTCWYKVTGQISSDIPVSSSMRIGTLIEEALFNIWCAENPEFESVYQPGTFAHDDFPQFISNPDAFITDEAGNKGVVDFKYSASFWDEVPEHYLWQVRWYMWVNDLDFAYVAGLIGGRWKQFRVERSDFLEEIMVESVLRFWEACVSLTRPAWDGSESTYETMREVNSDIVAGDVELGELGRNLMDAVIGFNDAQSDLNEAKSRVLDALGDSRNGLLNGERICYRQMASSGKPFLKVM